MNSGRVYAIMALVLFAGVSQPGIAGSGSHKAAALTPDDYFGMWIRASHHQCPGNYVEWEVLSVDAMNLVGSFLATLSAPDLKKVHRVVSADDRCRGEEFGFTCEVSVYVGGFRRFGLLKRFAKFGCDNIYCDKDGLCKTFPAGRRMR
jgi:hypothetical protein